MDWPWDENCTPLEELSMGAALVRAFVYTQQDLLL